MLGNAEPQIKFPSELAVKGLTYWELWRVWSPGWRCCRGCCRQSRSPSSHSGWHWQWSSARSWSSSPLYWQRPAGEERLLLTVNRSKVTQRKSSNFSESFGKLRPKFDGKLRVILTFIYFFQDWALHYFFPSSLMSFLNPKLVSWNKEQTRIIMRGGVRPRH